MLAVALSIGKTHRAAEKNAPPRADRARGCKRGRRGSPRVSAGATRAHPLFGSFWRQLEKSVRIGANGGNERVARGRG